MIYLAAFCVTRSYFIFYIFFMLLSSPSKSFDDRRASTIHFIWSVSTYLEHFSLVHLFAAAVSSHVVLLPYATETVARLEEKNQPPPNTCPSQSIPFIMYSKNGTFFSAVRDSKSHDAWCTYPITWNRRKMPRFISFQWQNHEQTSSMPALTTRRNNKKWSHLCTHK